MAFPAVSLPAFDHGCATVPKLMICYGLCRGPGFEKIFTLSFPVRQGNEGGWRLPPLPLYLGEVQPDRTHSTA
jgi:hypothetical protein